VPVIPTKKSAALHRIGMAGTDPRIKSGTAMTKVKTSPPLKWIRSGLLHRITLLHAPLEMGRGAGVAAQEAAVGPIGGAIFDAAGMICEIRMPIGASAFDAGAGLGSLQQG